MDTSWLVLTVLLATATADRHTIDDLYDLVSRIDENLRKDDRLREITKILEIDATLKRFESTLNEISEKVKDDPGRGMSFDLRNNLHSIDARMQNVEGVTQSLKTTLVRIDDELKVLDAMEQKTETMKKELYHRLNKMMNIISSLYQMSKDMKEDLGNGHKDGEKTYAGDYPLDDMERKLVEQISIMSVDLKKELGSLKTLTTTLVGQCDSSENEDPLPSEHRRKEGSASKEELNDFNLLAMNLSRSQREIKEEFHLGMQNLNKKITELTTFNGKCAEESRNSILATEAPEEAKCVSDQFVQDARNCADLRKSGTTCSGVYFVFHSFGQAIRVYCDMTTDGGGWTVIMRRGDYDRAPLNFNLPWSVYKRGFGDLNEEFWLGNEYIYLLTNEEETNQLRIDLESFSDGWRNFTYDSFSIENEISEYRMHIKDSLGRRPTAFLHFNNRPFVTYDRITDQPGESCAEKYKGGWWYRKHCIYPVLTGERLGSDARTSMVGMQSSLWREAGVLKGAEMKIRPKDFLV